MPINKYEEPRQFLPTCALDRCTAIHPHVVLYHIDFGDLHFYMCKPHALIAGTLGIAALANEADDDLVRSAINDMTDDMDNDVGDWDMPPTAYQGFAVSDGIAKELINAGIVGEVIDLGKGIVAIPLRPEELPSFQDVENDHR